MSRGVVGKSHAPVLAMFGRTGEAEEFWRPSARLERVRVDYSAASWNLHPFAVGIGEQEPP